MYTPKQVFCPQYFIAKKKSTRKDSMSFRLSARKFYTHKSAFYKISQTFPQDLDEDHVVGNKKKIRIMTITEFFLIFLDLQ